MSDTMNSKALYARLLKHVKPHRNIFILSLLGTIGTAATEPALPAIFKYILDDSFLKQDATSIVLLPILLVIVIIVRGALNFVSNVGLNWVAYKVVTELREAMFQNLLHIPTAYFDNQSSGTLISKVTYDASQVMAAATTVFITIVKDSIIIIGLLGLMFFYSWKLSLFALIVAPVIATLVKLASFRLRQLNRRLQKSMGDMTHVLGEATNGHKIIKLFNGGKYEANRFYATANWVRRLENKLKIAATLNVSVVQVITGCALAGIVYLASIQVQGEALTVGEFFAFFTSMGLLFSPIKRLTNINEQLQRGLAASESVFALIDQNAEKDTGTSTIDNPSGELVFENVRHQYESTDKPAVKNINFTVKPGETVALVGQSGSGKTTIANLVPRFYDITEGCIKLDGVSIHDLPLSRLRELITYVGQEVVLFNDSVRNNIAYGPLQQASDDEVRAAAKDAFALDFINNLPEGFDTEIGENGVKLSGGQRQRLAIARALLKDAPILILDEATSALDTESEKQVQLALERLQKNRTTLVIAHRLSTIENADRILVLDQGEIKEQGTHKELLAQQGIYARLHAMQFVETKQPTTA